MSGAPAQPPATLPDLLRPGLRLVVVGINPSLYSVAVGHYYARPGNDFWKLLAESGLTGRVFAPSEDRELPGLGIGLTDLVKTPSNNFDELPSAAFAGALDDLRRRLAIAEPAVVLFNGSGGLERTLRRRPGFGRLDPTIAIGRAAVFCMPSSSGAARGKRGLALSILQEAAALAFPERFPAGAVPGSTEAVSVDPLPSPAARSSGSLNPGRIELRIRGARPVPWGTGEWSWRAEVARAALQMRAVSPVPTPPADAGLTVFLTFYLAPARHRDSDLDNLAKPVLDTLFHARHVQARVPDVTGVLFDVPDERVVKLVLEKRLAGRMDDQGIDVIVTW
jgi:double-stranded uracil-DNA glycosylase